MLIGLHLVGAFSLGYAGERALHATGHQYHLHAMRVADAQVIHNDLLPLMSDSIFEATDEA